MDTGSNTSDKGAAVGAALGWFLVWLVEEISLRVLEPPLDIPAPIEGSLIVITVFLVARVIPPTTSANP